jgi:hypothetical protein
MNVLSFALSAIVVITLAGHAVVFGQTPQREWTLQPGDDAFGVILAATRCGDVLYFGDTQQKIHRYNLQTRRLLTALGGDRVAFPTSLTTDCSRRRLYLVTGIPLGKNATAAVQMFNLDTGELLREYALPRFLPRAGTVLDGVNSLLISGLWVQPDRAPEDLLHQPADRYYENVRLGLRLSLLTGEIEPALIPYEFTCIGGGQCPDVRTGGMGTKQRTVQVASLPTSTRIGIYEQGRTVRMMSVTSPRFTRTGETLPVFVGTDVRMRWLSENSTIDGVYAFDAGIAVVHYRAILPANYHVGERTAFSVFMNTYRWDGTALDVDTPLPDFPVGHDDTSLYVIDYGPQLRRENAGSLRLVQIPMNAR